MMTRRRLFTWGAAGCLAAWTLLGGAGAAGAADATADLSVSVPAQFFVTTPATSDYTLYVVELMALDDAQHVVRAKNVVLTVDVGALTGKAQIKPETGCTAKGTVITCKEYSFTGGNEVFPFSVRQAPGAKVGSSGKVTFTVTADNAPTVTATSTLVVGGPKLLSRTHPAVKGVAPLGNFALTPGFKNTGDLPAHGVGVVLHGTDSMLMARKYDNCHYVGPDTPQQNADLYCLFPDVTVAPGQSFEFAEPLSYKADTVLMYGRIQYSAWALDGPTLPGLDLGYYRTPGTGPALGLKSTTAGPFASDGGFVQVSTSQHADFEVSGATVKGAVGQTVSFSVSVHNNGPGSMQLMDYPGYSGGIVKVTIPAGLTVVSLPREEGVKVCDPGTKGAKTYTCTLHETFYAGDDESFGFAVRIDKAVAGAKGTVTAAGRADYPNRDNVPSNDTAPILVQVTGGSGASASGSGGSGSGGSAGSGGSTTGGGTATAGGSTGSTSGSGGVSGGTSATGSTTSGGGSLAATGSSSTMPAAALSAAALLTGTAVLLVFRRRRTRTGQ